NTIALHQRKIEQLNTLKKGYLQHLFPRNDEKMPRVRFANFEGGWEERKLKEVLKERNSQQHQNANYPLVSFTVENGVTPKTERYNREQLVVGSKDQKKYKITELDDIVYNPANLKFGAIARNSFGKAVFSPIYVTFEVNKNLARPSYVERFIVRPDFIRYSLKYQQGTVYERQSVSPTDLLSLNISVPSEDEQIRISDIFMHIDNTIILYQKKLENLIAIKKLYLQKMFI
ncbi:restriction endonuclease subunit S, partial [Streptococcus parauberis]